MALKGYVKSGRQVIQKMSLTLTNDVETPRIKSIAG